MLCGPAERITKARKVHGERRQYVDPQRIARKARVQVRFVVDPRELALRRIALELRAQQPQQRTHALDACRRRTVARRHRGDPGDTRAAQQLQQHRLGLIVGVLRQPQHGRAMPLAHRVERRVAALPRTRLDPGAAVARHVDAHRIECDAELRGARLRVRGPRVGVRAQPVVDMQRDAARRARDAYGRVEQHRRVEPAAVRDRDACAGRRVGKRNADRIEDDAVGGKFARWDHDGKARTRARCDGRTRRVMRPAWFP
ncbi:hypothetical protein BUB20358_05593 [Burkholderia ubonensis]|nr:hypothetical protein BUB20358_05593 [Burkholderia ubonensis]